MIEEDQEQAAENAPAGPPERRRREGAEARAAAAAGPEADADEPEDDPELVRDEDHADTCPGKPDPDPPAGSLLDLRIQSETAEALKPIMIEKIYFADPKTDAERKAAEDAYRAEAKRPDGPVWKKYMRANWTFDEIGEELREKKDGETRLRRWIRKYLSPGTELIKIFEERKRVESLLLQGMGPRECRYRRATDRLKAWDDAYVAWKTPAARIGTMIDKYAPVLETLRTQIHDGDDYAIYRFWFEIAPQHLRLRDTPVRESNAYGITAIANALRAFPDRRRALESGKVLDDGSLFLLDPGAGGGRPLEAQRKHVLNRREAAAKGYAKRKAMFDDKPDTILPLAKQLEEVTRREANARQIFPA